MQKPDATVQYFTDRFRTCSSSALRQAVAAGLPWPEHVAARTILRERTNLAAGSRVELQPTHSSPSVHGVVRRILGGMALLFFRVIFSASSKPWTRAILRPHG